MTHRIAALVAAALLAVAAPATSTLARDVRAPVDRPLPASPYDDLTTGSVGPQGGNPAFGCAHSSASEGNAKQQNFPVMQYGQTSGGPRC